MTAHDHAEYVAGCFRCDLSHYEHMADNRTEEDEQFEQFIRNRGRRDKEEN